MAVRLVRKLFIDSRYKVSGTDEDCLIELPNDVDCTRTSSFFVASCSFANTYQTLTSFNNKLFSVFIDVSGIVKPPYRLVVSSIPQGNYTPDTFGPALKTALGDGCLSVTWNATLGNFNIQFRNTGTLQPQYIIPNSNEIDAIVRQLGTNISTDVGYVPGNKFQSVNTLLNMATILPMPLIYGAYSIATGVVDLSPLREVYLHSSLASNRTLHVNGSTDCIARIPIDVGYGEIVTYRHLGPTDALSCSDLHFRTVRFQLRDWAGNLAPTGSFVVIELCFLDSDPYAM